MAATFCMPQKIKGGIQNMMGIQNMALHRRFKLEAKNNIIKGLAHVIKVETLSISESQYLNTFTSQVLEQKEVNRRGHKKSANKTIP